MGPYDGIVAAVLDRVGRNVRDTLNTQTMLTGQGRRRVTADHAGVWDFSDPNQENEWLSKAWGSQMELSAIQKRNRDETVRAREAGEPKQMPSYGYMYVRLAPTAKIDHVALDPVAVEITREAARRILSDETGKITGATEAARLTREGIPSPSDRRAQLYGRPVKGGPWTAKTVKHILCSEAALGYLMHDGRPVTGADRRPMRIAEPLWDRATHDRWSRRRRRNATEAARRRACSCCRGGVLRELRGAAVHRRPSRLQARLRMYRAGTRDSRVGGVQARPDYGDHGSWTRWSASGSWPGTGPGRSCGRSTIRVLGTRPRSRNLRPPARGCARTAKPGSTTDADDAEWYRTEYRRLGEEITALKALPERKPGMRMVPTGRTIAQEWDAVDDARRREMLAEFEVRVVLHPTGHDPRVAITGMEIIPDGPSRPADQPVKRRTARHLTGGRAVRSSSPAALTGW